MKFKAIIFDYDGVIQNTFEFHRQKVGEFTGLLLPEDEFRDVHNGNFFDNNEHALKNVNWESYRDFIYDPQHKLTTEEIIKNTLIALSNKHDLFIVTSGGKKNISDYLKNNGIYDIFKEVFGLEANTSKVDKFNSLLEKYSLAPDDCIFITDTLGDILEANKVNIQTIAVDFGYHPRETLAKGNPALIISDIRALLEIEKIMS